MDDWVHDPDGDSDGHTSSAAEPRERTYVDIDELESARGRSARIAGFVLGKRLYWPIAYLPKASERLWMTIKVAGRAVAALPYRPP
jgi:hypothetical protein